MSVNETNLNVHVTKEVEAEIGNAVTTDGTLKVYPIEEGILNYPVFNTETGRRERKIFIRGVNIEPEVFDCLKESYHDEYLGDRYYEEHQDYAFEMKKARFEMGADGVTQEPMAEITDDKADVFKQIFEKAVKEPEIVKVFTERVLPQLTEAQKNLIFAHYGERRTLESIRLEEAAITGKEVTHQAMSNRLKKIHKRVEKLMPEFLPIKE